MANQYRSVLAGAAGTGGDAVAANVLAGKTFTNDNGFDTGTMVNNGAVTQTLSAGQSYTIPEGYHNGSGTVSAPALSVIDKGTIAPSATKSFSNKIGHVVTISGGGLTGVSFSGATLLDEIDDVVFQKIFKIDSASATLTNGPSYTIAFSEIG